MYIEEKTGLKTTLHEIRASHPNISIPDGADLTELGYGKLLLVPAPRPSRWQVVREIAAIKVDGIWTQQFELYDLPLPLDYKRAEIKRQADDIARVRRDQVVAGISPAEMASWPIKRAEAIAFSVSGLESDAPALLRESIVRGVPLSVLADKVLAKSDQLATLEAGIAGRCGAIQDAAAAAQSEADLLAIDLEAGWPI